jgi:membrane protease YdiL (CAAX protease family)
MKDQPLVVAAMIAGCAYLFHLWWSDLRAAHAGRPNPKAFPGAEPCERRVLFLAIVGTLLLLAAETCGEVALGLFEQQKKITVLWALYTLVAAFIEELTFRGYLVIKNRGQNVLWAGVFALSLVFALAHPFLWDWVDGRLVLQLTAKNWFSTAFIFAGSLWFYALRFLSINPKQSLLPCILGHLTKNLGVVIIKAATGFVSGLY